MCFCLFPSCRSISAEGAGGFPVKTLRGEGKYSSDPFLRFSASNSTGQDQRRHFRNPLTRRTISGIPPDHNRNRRKKKLAIYPPGGAWAISISAVERISYVDISFQPRMSRNRWTGRHKNSRPIFRPRRHNETPERSTYIESSVQQRPGLTDVQGGRRIEHQLRRRFFHLHCVVLVAVQVQSHVIWRHLEREPGRGNGSDRN